MAPRKKSLTASATKIPEQIHLVKGSYDIANAAVNPWTSIETIGTQTKDAFDTFIDTVDECRFFYKTEPVVSTVINKLIEIGINNLVFKKAKLSDNEFRLFTQYLKPKLLEFSEVMAQEFLLSGLVVPEISYGKIDKEDFADVGVKKYSSLIVPTSMFVRDPKTIVINSSMLSDTPSYFIQIPGDIIDFIKEEGKYADGMEDKELYNNLKTYYPDFVAAVQAGETEVPVSPETSRLVLRRRYLTDEPYPIPYIAPVLDALKHKRELRRMDYSIIDKIISAILHVKVGSDQFPTTQSDEDVEMVEGLRRQLAYRFNTNQNLERIFQLLTNHTVQLNWVFPDTAVLLNENKYKDINQEILFGLGFPQVLITGESQRTGTSDPELAMIAPVKTMENFREKIIKVVKEICKQVALQNSFSGIPEVNFSSLNLHAFADFMAALDKLYAVSGVSRTAYGEALGYDFTEQLDYLKEENDELVASGLPEFGPTPNSRNPNNPLKGNTNQSQTNNVDTTNTQNTGDKTVSNPADNQQSQPQTSVSLQ